MSMDHFKIATDAMNGRGRADRQVVESISVLEERLNRLRAMGSEFAEVTFSPAFSNLSAQISAAV